MKSKLSNGYPTADPAQWLVFAHPWQNRIDPVLAGRLAALARDSGKKINILSGFRSREEQEESFKNSRPGYAAKPGNSWHEYGEAVDVSDLWLKELDKDAATGKQKNLLKYGLFKPLTKGNGCTILEDWHIQPVETVGISDNAAKREFFITYLEGLQMDIGTFQMMVGLTPDGVVGPVTLAKMKEVKALLDTHIKPEPVHVKVSGVAVDDGILIDGKSYAPVRVVAEACGKKVDWDGATKTVNIK